MSPTLPGFILILIFASNRILLSDGFGIDYDNANITLHHDNVTWTSALSSCDASSSRLLYLNEDNANIVAQIKRQSHFRTNTSAWIGNYVTYDVNFLQDSTVNISIDLCLAMSFKYEQTSGTTYTYFYDIVAINCTLQLYSACNVSQSSTVIFSTSKSSRTSGQNLCSSSKSLWSPPMSFTSIASNNTIGSGNFSGSSYNGDLVGNEYWIHGYMSTFNRYTPGDGTKYQCGYLATMESNIKYDDCNKKKSYLCISGETITSTTKSNGLHTTIMTNTAHLLPITSLKVETTTRSNVQPVTSPDTQTTSVKSLRHTPSKQSMTSSKTKIYIGSALGSIFFILCAVGVIILCRRKRGQVSDGASMPKGGKSFKRQKSENSSELNGDNRLTTYNQINIEDLTNLADDRLADQDQPRAYSVEDSEDLAYAMYTPIIHKPKTLPLSSAPPKPARSGSRTGYLTMDGKRPLNTEYDVLKSIGSVKSVQDSRETDVDQENNYYDIPKIGEQMDEHESFYDSTIMRHPSQKALLNNDYDHITLDPDPEMNRSICNSTGSAKRPVPLPRSNPGYEKMNEIVK